MQLANAQPSMCLVYVRTAGRGGRPPLRREATKWGAMGRGSEGSYERAGSSGLCGRECQGPAWLVTSAMLPAKEAGRGARGEAANELALGRGREGT
eukprot:2550676-Rhodomonas_salina.2